MRLFTGTHTDQNGQVIAEWFGRQVGRQQFAPYFAMGWADAEGLRSAALFNDYQLGSNIELHVVGRLTRQTIRDAFDYAFNKLGILHLRAKPRRSNKPLRKMIPRVGFVYEATLQRYYGPHRGDDALVFRLDRDTAMKWI